MKQPYLGVW